jgi:hypothetical protein
VVFATDQTVGDDRRVDVDVEVRCLTVLDEPVRATCAATDAHVVSLDPFLEYATLASKVVMRAVVDVDHEVGPPVGGITWLVPARWRTVAKHPHPLHFTTSTLCPRVVVVPGRSQLGLCWPRSLRCRLASNCRSSAAERSAALVTTSPWLGDVC